MCWNSKMLFADHHIRTLLFFCLSMGPWCLVYRAVNQGEAEETGVLLPHLDTPLIQRVCVYVCVCVRESHTRRLSHYIQLPVACFNNKEQRKHLALSARTHTSTLTRDVRGYKILTQLLMPEFAKHTHSWYQSQFSLYRKHRQVACLK